MDKYDYIGLDNKMFAKTSLSNRYVATSGVQFEGLYDVQSNKLNASKFNLGQFIKLSVGGTAVGNFSTFQALNITSTITYNTPKAQNKTFGKPIIGIYQGAGTAVADQIFPLRGTNVTLGRYTVSGGVINYNTYNGTSDQWACMITDTTGTSTQQITFAANWLFTDYVTDTVS